MRTFELVSTSGNLGQIRQVPGNVEKYRANLDGLLDHGIHVTIATASVTSSHSTVSVPVPGVRERGFSWLLTTTGTAETFVLSLQATTSDGQTLNWVLTVEVAAPLVS